MSLYADMTFYGQRLTTILVITWVLITVTITMIDTHSYNRKRNYLEKIGFERKLYYISSDNGPGKYAFKRCKDIEGNKDLECVEFIYENTLDKMSYKEIKRRYK